MSDSKKVDTRPVISGAFTGVPRSGKSTLAQNVCKKMKLKKGLVVTFSGAGNTWNHAKEISPTKKELVFKSGWRHIKLLKWKGKVDVMEMIYKYYRNGALIFDDCKNYLKANVESTPFLIPICADLRHHGYDLFFIAHSPKQIPPDVWTYLKHAWVFACTRKYKESELKCERPDKMIRAQEIVNQEYNKIYKETKKEPWGVYKYVKI